MKLRHFAITGVILFVFTAGAFAKDGRIVMSSFCEYRGNVENKLASGQGTLTIEHPLLKDLWDEVSGTFIADGDGYIVTNATIKFFSVWTYTGKLRLTVDKGNAKNSSVKFELTEGKMEYPRLENPIIITKDPVVFYRIYNKNEKKYTLSNLVFHGRKAFKYVKEYTKYAKCDSIYCDYNMPIKEEGDLWSYIYDMQISSPLIFLNGCTCHFSQNDWICTTPKKDTVIFWDGKYKAIKRNSTTYLYYVPKEESVFRTPEAGQYCGTIELKVPLDQVLGKDNINDDIVFNTGEQTFSNGSKITYSRGNIKEAFVIMEDGNFYYSEYDGANITLNNNVNGFSGAISLTRPVQEAITKKKISDIEFRPKEGSMQLSEGNVLYFNRYGEIIGCRKRFTDADLDIKDGNGNITYSNGRTYSGTMDIWDGISAESVRSWVSINDIALEYKNGIETHPDGTSDTWVNGLTELMRNKLGY